MRRRFVCQRETNNFQKRNGDRDSVGGNEVMDKKIVLVDLKLDEVEREWMNCTRTQVVGVGMGNTEDNCMGERSGLSLYLNRGFERERHPLWVWDQTELWENTRRTVWRISRKLWWFSLSLSLSLYVFLCDVCVSLYTQYYVYFIVILSSNNNNVKLLFM